MTLLEKIDYLMKKEGINKHELARLSGIPYTTIVGLYERGVDKIRLSTVQKIGDYFNVSIDYLAYDKYDYPESYGLPDMSPDEYRLIGLYRASDEAHRMVAIEVLESGEVKEKNRA